MKFIHTSDWHIGRQFHNVSLLDDQRHVLNQIVEYVQVHQVDALVIAGDIYDRAIPPAAAVELLDEVLTTITMKLNVPVIMISGNHDSAQRLRFGSHQLRQSGLHILGTLADITKPVIIKSDSGDTAFYGIPYSDPETVRHFLGDSNNNDLSNGIRGQEAISTEPELQNMSTYDQAHSYLVNKINSVKTSTQANVLISHCFISGAQASDSERPLSIGGSDQVSYQPCESFDYVALGHLHSPQYRGAQHIRYSGSILKYSFSEVTQKKGVTLVELDSNANATSTHLPLSPLRDMRIIEDKLANILEQGRVDPNKDDYLLVKMTDHMAILEPMAKLREVYPNVLQLEKPGMLTTGDQLMTREKLKHSEIDMFRDFFLQVSGQALTPEQEDSIKNTISELLKQESNT